MADDRKKQLDDLVKRRDLVKERKQRLQGKLEAARTELASVEEECRKRGVPPEKLDAAIEQLGTRYNKAVAELTEQLSVAESNLAPFLEDRG
jgi:septal ring factor EnvC (AmiA/AmiB activator)